MNIEKNSNMMHYRIYTEISLIIKKMSLLKILMGLKIGFYIYFCHYILGRNVFMIFSQSTVF